MAHEILGQRFIARSQPAWHNIAKRIFGEGETITAREAMVEVAGDVQVVRAPLFYEMDGKMTRADGQAAIVRKALPDSPSEVMLGVTSDKWAVTDYATLAGALDPLAAQYKVETAGLLKEGSLAFLCFRAEDWSVKGDPMRSYFAANFSLQPGKGHKVFHSPVRVVCWNTNTQAENSATINLSIPHTADALQKIQLAAMLAARFVEMKDRAKAVFEAFAETYVTAAQAEAIFRAAFPQPSVPAKVRLLKQHLSESEAAEFKRLLTADLLMAVQVAEETYERQREQVAALIEECGRRYDAFKPANLKGTAWAAYNAVTEVSDWREGRNADYSAVLGTRAQEKSRAYVEAVKLLEAK